MNTWSRHRHALATGLFAAVSLAVAAGSWREVTFLQRQVAARKSELAALDRFRAEVATHRAAHDWMAANARDEDRLESLVRTHLSGIPHDMALRERRDDGGGWSFQRYDLRIERIDAAAAGRFLAACENARPPVRIVDIQASADAGTDPRYILQLTLAEATRKAPGSGP